ncbi:MAG: TlpA family protein disulfide reductase, partial [Gammaproteobacteria bacterium]
MTQILAARQGKPLVLVLWSIDCSACVSELGVLARSVQEHPGMDLVFVATDDTARAEEAQRVLSRHGLGDRESWIFADTNRQRLRYEIDPRWYGELPRSYFYDHNHRRVPLSGKLQQQHL